MATRALSRCIERPHPRWRQPEISVWYPQEAGQPESFSPWNSGSARRQVFIKWESEYLLKYSFFIITNDTSFHLILLQPYTGRGWADSLAELAGVKTLCVHHCETQHLHETWHRQSWGNRKYTEEEKLHIKQPGLSDSETRTFIISQITSLAKVSHLYITDSLCWRAGIRWDRYFLRGSPCVTPVPLEWKIAPWELSATPDAPFTAMAQWRENW